MEDITVRRRCKAEIAFWSGAAVSDNEMTRLLKTLGVVYYGCPAERFVTSFVCNYFHAGTRVTSEWTVITRGINNVRLFYDRTDE